MRLLAQHTKILFGVTPLVVRQLVVIRPEALKRRCGHEQESSWSHTSVDLVKNCFVIRDVFEHIEEKNNVPLFAPTEVKQIDLVSLGEGADHWFGQREGSHRAIAEGKFLKQAEVVNMEVFEPPATTSPHINDA